MDEPRFSEYVPDVRDALRNHLYVLNQLYALRRRLRNCRELPDGALRPLDRIEEHLRSSLHAPGVLPDGYGLVVDEPGPGQAYDECCTDLEAEVVGEGEGPLVVVDVVRPIIRLTAEGRTYIIQRGRVVVAPQTPKGDEP
jgi:hypothetical protein